MNSDGWSGFQISETNTATRAIPLFGSFIEEDFEGHCPARFRGRQELCEFRTVRHIRWDRGGGLGFRVQVLPVGHIRWDRGGRV